MAEQDGMGIFSAIGKLIDFVWYGEKQLRQVQQHIEELDRQVAAKLAHLHEAADVKCPICGVEYRCVNRDGTCRGCGELRDDVISKWGRQ